MHHSIFSAATVARFALLSTVRAVGVGNDAAQAACKGFPPQSLKCLTDVSYVVCSGGVNVANETETFVPTNASCIQGIQGEKIDYLNLSQVATTTRTFDQQPPTVPYTPAPEPSSSGSSAPSVGVGDEAAKKACIGFPPNAMKCLTDVSYVYCSGGLNNETEFFVPIGATCVQGTQGKQKDYIDLAADATTTRTYFQQPPMSTYTPPASAADPSHPYNFSSIAYAPVPSDSSSVPTLSISVYPTPASTDSAFATYNSLSSRDASSSSSGDLTSDTNTVSLSSSSSMPMLQGSSAIVASQESASAASASAASAAASAASALGLSSAPTGSEYYAATAASAASAASGVDAALGAVATPTPTSWTGSLATMWSTLSTNTCCVCTCTA